MAIHIDAEKCDGYASCVLLAPAVFDLDDADNVAVVIDADADRTDPASVDEAIQNCPRRAITLRD